MSIEYIDEFDILVKKGNIGFYESCRMLNIVLKNNSTGKYYNYFSQFLFRDSKEEQKNIQFGDKTIDILGGKYSLCYGFKDLSIVDCRKKLEYVVKSESTVHLELENFLFTINNLIPKQYVSDNAACRISQGLGVSDMGDYVLELFDEEKKYIADIYSQLSTQKVKKFFNKISNKFNINLSLITDKGGGIVFQFPVSVCKINADFDFLKRSIRLQFEWNEKVLDHKKCIITGQAKIGKVFSGFGCVNHDGGPYRDIFIGNFDSNIEMLVYKTHPNLIIARIDCDCPRVLEIRGVVTDGKSIRIFNDKEGEQKLNIGKQLKDRSKGTDYLTYVNAHLYSNDLDNLETHNIFFHLKKGSRKKAFITIRSLIKRYATNQVLLWDPYLRSEDLFNTLYHCNLYDVELLGLGSITDATREIYEDKGKSFNDIIHQEQVKIEMPPNNNLGLDLKFRLQHSSKGFSFHDRFLLFTGSYDVAPIGFSLGSSINSIGNSHSIIQQIQHPQCVIDSFLELWDKLNHENNIVWPIPKSVEKKK